ncbi:ferredoxin [Endomicrobiia bacterium]|nr:ferredoxin [Endomicrobiia bacterium]GHT67523.1 ferredoxin [Endomicrobiia bacterium]GHT71431.1 ferredoxin [Endomicrobiia bacterium]GHT76664.1 ferredoxin [Endomicrobiia bacterium]
MTYQIDETVCVGCGACADSCPVAAINQKGDKYKIDPETCVGCGACESTCPVSAISKETR